MPLSVSQRPVIVFLARMLAIYAAWFVLYDLWLLPDGRLDAAVARNVAWLAGLLLRGAGGTAVVEDRTVWTGEGQGVWVDDGCTGLAVVGLFFGFVLAFPGSWRRRALFLPAGALVIHLANAGRVAFLAWLHRARPEVFDATHEWGILPFFYAVVFVLWLGWIHYGAGRPRRALQPAGAG